MNDNRYQLELWEVFLGSFILMLLSFMLLTPFFLFTITLYKLGEYNVKV